MNLYGKVNVNNISKNIDLSYFESHKLLMKKMKILQKKSSNSGWNQHKSLVIFSFKSKIFTTFEVSKNLLQL